ncbi:MAG TPA: hypothetical protein VF057_10850 [Thermoanaerobaculia bacterium]
MFGRLFVLMVILALVGACAQEEPDATVTAPEPSTETTQTTAAAAQEPVMLDGFSTPESVLYDPEQDVYFVSNINGAPLDVDDNGFISRVNAETRQVELKWIDGGAQNVQLSAPKGLAIVGDELWVSDITKIAKFDRKTGQPKGTFNVPGSTFLNDVTSEVGVFVSDSGMKSDGKGGFAPTGTDAVWEVTGSKPKKVASGKDLKGPNGLQQSAGHLWAVTFAGNELYALDNGKKTNAVTLPQGGLDGLVILDDGSFLVTSWDGKTIYRGTSGGQFQPAVENVNAPADIGFDSKRRMILVPMFMDNRVALHPLR